MKGRFRPQPVSSYFRSVRANPDEAARTLPGDELITQPLGSLNHAITIRRPRYEVWPWLTQMGAGSRAGWYSYDFLDNGRRPSAERIVPELQELALGMIFPAVPGATDGFTLLAFEALNFLILGWLTPKGAPLMTWAFVLEDVDHGSTRLIVRARAGTGYHFLHLPWWAAKRIVSPIHFVMQRQQLLGIAKRAERGMTGAQSTSTDGSTLNDVLGTLIEHPDGRRGIYRRVVGASRDHHGVVGKSGPGPMAAA